MELAGTLGIDPAQVRLQMAGGPPGDTRDGADAASRDVAIALGARVIAVANLASAPLYDGAATAICLPSGPKAIAGPTRLDTDTAQKIALNLMARQAGAIMGHGPDGQMVNLRPDNIKLRQSAAWIVASLADCDGPTTRVALAAAGQHVKTAVLLALVARLERYTKGHLADLSHLAFSAKSSPVAKSA